MGKLAIVVQRYGKEINGGAEQHARMLAEHLKDSYEIEILTSCAFEYVNWDNYYKEGLEVIDGINVRRFPSKKKDSKKAGILTRYFYKTVKYRKRKINPFNFLYLIIKRKKYKYTEEKFQEWLKETGPYCEDLIIYLKQNKAQYKAIIFFTYLYYPTNFGIREVSDKSILIPTAHDEPAFYYGFHELFKIPKFIMYNTLSEKRLVECVYPDSKSISSDVAGVGFDMPVISIVNNNIPDFRYILYIGRIEENKGCKILMDFFKQLDQKYKGELKLVMVGEKYMDIEFSDNIIFTGFITEQEKWIYLKHTEALVIPSLYESLSMVTLEAMSFGKPVLANEKCEVLKDHINISKAGFLYNDYEEFSLQIKKILGLSNSEKEDMANNGKAYVNKNYQWTSIIDKFKRAIEYVDAGK
ncbi:MAG: glycosyltransferase family 4 protein [Flavobacteriaceae bacterium]|jgi:glycosyltransferase involved in cell wall biosynthesis|nr:glycosyltransferase family 4 protein [Flavobacteriaceae bacterium]